jgi:hypothetical protein
VRWLVLLDTNGVRFVSPIICSMLLLCLLATPAAAEVMDKEPTLREIWRAALLWCLPALLAGRFHPLLGVLLLFMPNDALIALSESHSEFVGLAIRREAGQGYITQTYCANAVWMLGYLAGVSLWSRQRFRSRAQPGAA